MTNRAHRSFRPSFDSLALRITPSDVTGIAVVATSQNGPAVVSPIAPSPDTLLTNVHVAHDPALSPFNPYTNTDLECGGPYIVDGPMRNPIGWADDGFEPVYIVD